VIVKLKCSISRLTKALIKVGAEAVNFKKKYEDLASQRGPCSASCYHHHTHPCEGCGRIGYLPSVWGEPTDGEVAELEASTKAKGRPKEVAL